MKFIDFSLASAARSYLVNGDIYNTNNVSMPNVLEKVQTSFANHAKEEAQLQKSKMEDTLKMEVADGNFTTFGEYDGKVFMFIVNRKDGFVNAIKVNKKRPPKFKGHACNIPDNTPLFDSNPFDRKQ